MRQRPTQGSALTDPRKARGEDAAFPNGLHLLQLLQFFQHGQQLSQPSGRARAVVGTLPATVGLGGIGLGLPSDLLPPRLNERSDPGQFVFDQTLRGRRGVRRCK